VIKAKGAVVYEQKEPARFTVEELEWDDPQENEIGVRLVSCGVCRSDWHIAVGDFKRETPILVGHEGAGVVERVGKKVTRVKVGDKILTSFIGVCGHCKPCLTGHGELCDNFDVDGHRKDGSWRAHNKKGQRIAQNCGLGSFSEYIVINELSAIPCGQDMDLTKIAITSCRVPTGWGAVINGAEAKPGCTALVIGLGGVGFNVLQGLKSAGAVVIIAADIHDKRKWAMDWGATHYIDASKQDVVKEVMKITGIGVDFAFDAAGSKQAHAWTVDSIHKGGRAIWVGCARDSEKNVEFNTSDFVNFEKNIVASFYGKQNPFVIVPNLLNLYRASKIKMGELITKEYKLEEINQVFEDAEAGKLICGLIRF